MQTVAAPFTDATWSKIAQRSLYGVVGLLAFAAAVLEATTHGGATIATAVLFLTAPDLSMLVGASTPKPKGYLAPQAVPVYNAVHRLAGPIALLAVFSVVPSSAGFAAGLAWLAHIAIDRAAGYGPRRSDGSIAA